MDGLRRNNEKKRRLEEICQEGISKHGLFAKADSRVLFSVVFNLLADSALSISLTLVSPVFLQGVFE